ncbi:major capsid protein P2 [Hydrogenophaga intermedia]|uniref:major capsid protein P2 n=1 Tax=Hydrogenophaga intermedia TaxID=65786 RepID=UPI0020436E00|nr:major capsid protein P2 [Hydrogenophaga intermedia]MCM3565906.1 major capsid protein P2 [Hydrogenophaga intermedia]
MTRKVKLPLIQNVGPNQRVTVRMPLGVTYNKVAFFTAGNINAALISNIVVKINGSERIRWNTQAHLQARNSYNRGASDANVLELDFIERGGKDEAAMTLGAIAATAEAGVQDLTIEFDLGNYVVTAASVITGVAEVDVPSRNKLIVRNRFFQRVFSGATEEQIVLPFGLNGEQLKRVYLFGTLAQLNHVRVRREGADEFEQLSQAQNEFFQRTYGKTPQAGLYVLDFTEHDLMGQMLNTAQIIGPDGQPKPIQNLDFRINVNAAGTWNIYTESITTNDRP